MSSVTPPPPPTAPPPIPAPAPAPTLTVIDPSAPLTRLRPGALLAAVISARLGQGLFQLQTAQGTITVQTGVALPEGGALDLLLVTAAPKVQFQIAAIDGKPPQAALKTPGATQAPGATPGASAGAVGGTAPGPPLGVGATFTVTLLRPAPGAGTPTSLAAQGAPPGAAPAANAGPRLPATAAPSSKHPPAAGAAPAAATKPGTALPAGTQFSVKVLAVTPSAAPAPRAPGGTVIEAGRILTGTVTGKTAAGQPIVHTRSGVMALIVRATLPEGTRVTMEVTAPPILPKMPEGMPLREGLLLGRGWPALNDAVKALAEANPAAARQLVNTVIPQPGPHLAANILFFLMALHGGDMRAWLGTNQARLLQHARPDILTRLGEDFSQLARMAEEPVSGEWRVALIPFYSEQELRQLRLYSRPHGDDGEGEGPSGTRFVIDMELSRLGRLQIDGLVRDGGKHLDLIVRTEAPLPGEMPGDIRQIFLNAQELTGFKGGIAFQAAPPDFVEAAPEKIIGDHLIA